MDDREATIAALLKRPLTETDMFDYIRRSPELAAQYTPVENYNELRRSYAAPDADRIMFNQILGEAGAVGDPFGITALQRLFGAKVPDQVLLNEAHGLSNRERKRYK